MAGENGTKVYSKEELDEAVQHAISRRDVKEIKDSLGEMGQRFDKLEKALTDGYITREEFKPVRNIVYGMVALILTGALTAVGYVILNRQSQPPVEVIQTPITAPVK